MAREMGRDRARSQEAAAGVRVRDEDSRAKAEAVGTEVRRVLEKQKVGAAGLGGECGG